MFYAHSTVCVNSSCNYNVLLSTVQQRIHFYVEILICFGCQYQLYSAYLIQELVMHYNRVICVSCKSQDN